MADIRSVRIRRFKLLRDVSLDLDYATVFVGGNNSGKSSILQALHFGVAVAQSARLASDRNWQEGVYSATFRPEQLIYCPTTEFWALGYNGQLRERRDTWIEVEIQQTDGRQCLIAIGPGRNGNVSVRIEGRELGELIQDISRPYTVYAPGLAGIARSETLLSQGVIRRIVARGDANLVLRNVLLWLFRVGEDWEKFRNDIRELFPNLALRVDFTDVSDEHIRISFDMGDRVANLPLDCVGTSVLQATQVLAYVTLFKPKLLLLDEPDSHMHPNNQAALCKLLLRLAKERDFQVIIATHSRHVFSATHHDVPTKWVSGGAIVEGVSTDDTTRLLEMGALDSLDFLGNPQLRSLVLTEDKDMAMVKAVLKASRFNLEETVVASYRGCSKIDAVLVLSSVMSDKAPNVHVVVHRDRDYLDEEDAKRYTEQIEAAGSSVFLTDPSDIEGYFVNPDHIHTLYPQVSAERASEIIDQATELTREESIEAITNIRTQLAWHRRVKLSDQPNVGEIARAAREEYDANPRLMRRGKLVLARLKSLLQNELAAHARLETETSAIAVKSLRAIADRIWAGAPKVGGG